MSRAEIVQIPPLKNINCDKMNRVSFKEVSVLVVERSNPASSKSRAMPR